jgi:hypothetical protein
MKISEAIAELTALQAAHGDLEIYKTNHLCTVPGAVVPLSAFEVGPILRKGGRRRHDVTGYGARGLSTEQVVSIE